MKCALPQPGTARVRRIKALARLHHSQRMIGVFPAHAVGLKAIEQGVARIVRSGEELYEEAVAAIERARNAAALYAKHGFVPSPDEEE